MEAGDNALAESMADPQMRIRDEEQLRSIYAPPRYLAVLDQLDRSCRLFIANSPLVIIGTAHPENGIDVSPRGDAPGFVRVLDDHTIVIPDRTGNNRLDSMCNLVVNSEIGLFFTIPGVHESLRLKGTAHISRDAGLIAACVADGKEPKSLLVVRVHWAFIHCGKALNRSRVWESDYRVDQKDWTLARATLENSIESTVKLR
jgi:PPOX class probable FMN-dependent enzyme